MDLTTFAKEAVADFRTVGSVAPSSRYLTRAMLRPLPLKRARLVVEVGPGTGVMTQALLNQIPFDASLLAFEINSRFCEHLRLNVCDSRLHVIHAGGEMLRSEVRRRGHERVDAVVSSLALGLMSSHQRCRFLHGLGSLLGDTGVFTQYQYFHGLQMENGRLKRFDLEKLLHRYFRSVKKKVVLRNLPPAFVFICRGPLTPESRRSVQVRLGRRGRHKLRDWRHRKKR